MFFAHLRKIESMPSLSRIRTALWCASAGAVIGIFTLNIASADELVDEIEFENKSAVTTGVVITTPQTSSADPSDQSQSSDPQNAGRSDELTVIEYDRGGRTIREYRSGGRLMYVETSKNGEPSYVFDYSGKDDHDDSRVRAGFVISNW